MTSANFNWGYKFSNKNKKKNSDDQEDDVNQGSDNDLFGGSQDFSDRRFTANESRTQDQDEDDESEFYKTNIPWNLNLRHSLTYANSRRNRDISNNSLMVSADVGLTPKWDVGVSTGYDFKNKGITYTNFRIERDLDSWVMNLAWTPFGDRQSWFFFIGVRSGMLSDLKYDKRRERDRRL
jgi:outer membrane usher protein FimD/PapC